jgi:probable phosphoglycerate mutase
MRKLLKTWLSGGGEKKILLLRHGDIGAGAGEKRFIGQTDVPLSETGRRQALYWRSCLAEVQPLRIVSSDLRRCKATARIIAADHGMDVTLQTELREILLGEWEGMTFGRVKERWPESFRQRGMDLARFRPPGGESFLDLQKRVIPVIEAAADRADRQILIVAHAGVNRVVLCGLLGMPVENLFRIAQGHGAMNLVDRQANGYRIASLNLLPPPPDVEPGTR